MDEYSWSVFALFTKMTEEMLKFDKNVQLIQESKVMKRDFMILILAFSTTCGGFVNKKIIESKRKSIGNKENLIEYQFCPFLEVMKNGCHDIDMLITLKFLCFSG